MNRVYKLIFNSSRGEYAVTDEAHAAKGKKKAISVAVAAVIGLAMGGGGNYRFPCGG